MPSAREDFVRRLEALRHLVQDQATLQILQHDLTDLEANERAKLLRNGLAVSAFALLEAFLKQRVAEILTRLSSSPLAFTELPLKLQRLCTVEVVNALRSQVEIRERANEDAVTLIQTTAQSLISTADSTFVLSDLAFGQSRSNINHEDVKKLLQAFNIPDGWGNATKFAKRMGLAPHSSREDFTEVAKRRHKGAHDVGVEIPIGDLQGYPAQALGIAAGFDALISRSAYKLLAGDKHFAMGSTPITESEVSIRFIEDAHDGQFRDVAEGAQKAALRDPDYSVALAGARSRASRVGGVIVTRELGAPRSWETTDLGPLRP